MAIRHRMGRPVTAGVLREMIKWMLTLKYLSSISSTSLLQTAGFVLLRPFQLMPRERVLSSTDENSFDLDRVGRDPFPRGNIFDKKVCINCQNKDYIATSVTFYLFTVFLAIVL